MMRFGSSTVRFSVVGIAAALMCLVCVYPGGATKGFVTKGGIVFAKPDGRKLKATLYLPAEPGETLRPGIVIIHGGGWVAGTRHQVRWYSKRFAEKGYVVMSIDYRMMPRYPFPHCLHDSKAAVRWLRMHAGEYRVDPERIMALGRSAGGHLATLLATTSPEDGLEGDQNPGPSSALAAAISLYGVSDLTGYAPSDDRGKGRVYRRSFMERFVGEEGQNGRDAFEAASPISYASAGTCPILFVHGTEDSLVAFEQSEAFHARLRSFGVPTRLLAAAGRGHAFDFFHHRDRGAVFELMLEFLEADGITNP